MRVFIWTVQWALLSVGCTFAVGLFLAILLNDPYLRWRRFYRAVLILPYAVPAFISALIWRGFSIPSWGNQPHPQSHHRLRGALAAGPRMG